MKLRILVEADFDDDPGGQLAAGNAANLVGLALETTADSYVIVVDPPEVVESATQSWADAAPWGAGASKAAITRMTDFWRTNRSIP